MTSIKKHSASELRAFLVALDEEVARTMPGENPRLLIIGGGAAALAYGFTRATFDLDLFERIDDRVRDAIARVRERADHAVPVEHAAIAQAPYNFDERLRELAIEGVSHLRLLVPAPEDLIVMKALRGAAHDLDAAAAIAQNQQLQVETLVRSMKETDHLIGLPSARRAVFLAVLARIFGDDVAESLRSTLVVGEDH